MPGVSFVPPLSGRANSCDVAGEANVESAIRDALATFAADEIVVAVRPEDEEGLVESRATADVSKRSVDGVPVRLVLISGSEQEPGTAEV